MSLVATATREAFTIGLAIIGGVGFESLMAQAAASPGLDLERIGEKLGIAGIAAVLLAFILRDLKNGLAEQSKHIEKLADATEKQTHGVHTLTESVRDLINKLGHK